MAQNEIQVQGADPISYYLRNMSYSDILSDMPIVSWGLANDLARIVYKTGDSSFKLMVDASGAANLPDARVLVTAEGGKASASTVTTTELTKLSGVTDNIQDQFIQRIETVKGSDDPGDIGLDFNPLDLTVTVISESAKPSITYESEGVLITSVIGDPKLSITLPDATGNYYFHIDGTGQLGYDSGSRTDDHIRRYFLLDQIRLSKKITDANPDQGDGSAKAYEISTVRFCEYRQANPVENYASYRTKSIQQDDATAITLEAVAGETTVGHSAGSYLTSLDFPFSIIQQAKASKPWAVFYREGTGVERTIKTGSPYLRGSDILTGQSGNIQYNVETGGVWSLADVPVNKFFISYILVAHGKFAQVTSLMPQKVYNSASVAEDQYKEDALKIRIAGEDFRSICICACVIFNDAGQIQTWSDGDTWKTLKL